MRGSQRRRVGCRCSRGSDLGRRCDRPASVGVGDVPPPTPTSRSVGTPAKGRTRQGTRPDLRRPRGLGGARGPRAGGARPRRRVAPAPDDAPAQHGRGRAAGALAAHTPPRSPGRGAARRRHDPPRRAVRGEHVRNDRPDRCRGAARALGRRGRALRVHRPPRLAPGTRGRGARGRAHRVRALGGALGGPRRPGGPSPAKASHAGRARACPRPRSRSSWRRRTVRTPCGSRARGGSS